MNSNEQMLREMLVKVARALPSELHERMAFVGGSTTALLLTDDIVKDSVRYTEDVDLIVKAVGYAQWTKVQKKLREHGFTESPEDEVICRMRLGVLKVDFMPDDASILGFTNRWYQAALETARPFELAPDVHINLLDPVYFVATKLEAWRGRGNDDPMASHDLEDLFTLVDGRESLGSEISQADEDVRIYIAYEFKQLQQHKEFEYALNGNISDPARADLIWQRWQSILGSADTSSGRS